MSKLKNHVFTVSRVVSSTPIKGGRRLLLGTYRPDVFIELTIPNELLDTLKWCFETNVTLTSVQ